MAYTHFNFKTKVDLKEAFKRGDILRVYEPAPCGPDITDGHLTIEGPHYPRSHRWYCIVQITNRTITRIIA